jgi:hypothetical protein
MSALKSARGVFALGKGENASDITPEVWDEGQVLLGMNQTLTNVTHDATNSLNAWEVIQKEMINTASAYQVPSYMVAINETSQFPSGVALDIANQPLVRARQTRIELNRENVRRKFHVERALASVATQKDKGVGATETWIPEDRKWPESAKEQVEIQKMLLDEQLATIPEVLVELDKAETPEAALELYNQWKEEGLLKQAAQPQQGNGVLSRLRAQQ